MIRGAHASPGRLTILVAVCALSACTPGADPATTPSLVGLGDGDELTVVVANADRDPTLVFGSFPVCVQDGGKAVLRGVDLTDAGGIELVAAGVRVLPAGGDAIATAPGPLPTDYDQIPGARLDLTCDAEQNAELALELRRVGDGTGTLDGVDLRYDTDGDEHQITYHVAITLCAGTDQPASCDQ